MRPVRMTEAHKTDGLAELVCSNCFRSDDAATNAVGLLHEEMRRAGSLVMSAGDAHKLPAGGALAVDRDGFSAEVTRRLGEHPLVAIERGEVAGLPPADWDSVIIATGPLTSPALAAAIQHADRRAELAFFDAIAPIVHLDSIDAGITWRQSRYDKAGPGGTGADYINCPMTETEYEAFLDALLAADKTSFKEWEASTPYFDGCLPIEVMAERGRETLRFGPMKPVGLTNPHRPGERPYAVVQLRQDNALGTLWNMVGFQTKLKHGEQARVFRMIPGLADAEFARLGGLHRNTFLNVAETARRRAAAEGAAAAALRRTDHRLRGLRRERCHRPARGPRGGRGAPRRDLAAAAAHHGVRRAARPYHRRPSVRREERSRSFQPMNINFGLFPPLEAPTHDAAGKRIAGKERGAAKKRAISARALADLDAWLGAPARAAAE